MVVRYIERTLVVLDKSRIQKAENHIDAILTSPSRGVIFIRVGVEGREMAIEMPVILDRDEQNYLTALYRAHGWPSVECETIGKRKQTMIFKL